MTASAQVPAGIRKARVQRVSLKGIYREGYLEVEARLTNKEGAAFLSEQRRHSYPFTLKEGGEHPG